MIFTNVLGLIMALRAPPPCRACGRALELSRDGYISIGTLSRSGAGVYNASKWAVNAFSGDRFQKGEVTERRVRCLLLVESRALATPIRTHHRPQGKRERKREDVHLHACAASRGHRPSHPLHGHPASPRHRLDDTWCTGSRDPGLVVTPRARPKVPVCGMDPRPRLFLGLLPDQRPDMFWVSAPVPCCEAGTVLLILYQ